MGHVSLPFEHGVLIVGVQNVNNDDSVVPQRRISLVLETHLLKNVSSH